MDKNASGGDKNISFSLINVFFLWRPPSWLGYKVCDIDSFNRNRDGKIRCIFNYQVSRVYAFPALNTSSILG